MRYHRLKELYEDYPINEGRWIYLCHQGRCRTFRAVESVDELVELIESTDEYNRCYYEIVPAGQPCRVYYDFDYTTDDNIEQLTDQLIHAVKRCVLSNAEDRGYPITENNLVFTTSSGEKKVSVHLVITGVRVGNTSQAHQVAKQLLTSLPPEYANYVDHSVYKTNQQFRLLTCHKYLTDRIKMLWYGNVNQYASLAKALEDTLISRPSNNDYLIEVSEQPSRHCSVDEYELGNEVVNAVMWHLRDYDFTIREIVGNMIILDRKSPSKCPNCCRVHEHENPFVVITASNVYFNCRRNSKALNLGHPDLLVEMHHDGSCERGDSNEGKEESKGITLDSNTTSPLQLISMLVERYR